MNILTQLIIFGLFLEGDVVGEDSVDLVLAVFNVEVQLVQNILEPILKMFLFVHFRKIKKFSHLKNIFDREQNMIKIKVFLNILQTQMVSKILKLL